MIAKALEKALEVVSNGIVLNATIFVMTANCNMTNMMRNTITCDCPAKDVSSSLYIEIFGYFVMCVSFVQLVTRW